MQDMLLNDDKENITYKPKKHKRKILTLTDILIAVVVVCCAAAVYFYYSAVSGSGSIAIVAKNNIELYRIDISQVDEPYDLTVDKEHNVVLYVENDGISFKSSDCKDQLCVKMGKISKDGETVVCLPNGCTVFIDSEKEPEIDAVLR